MTKPSSEPAPTPSVDVGGGAKLTRAPSLSAFLAAPAGHYLSEEGFAYWSWSPALFGISFWGRPTLAAFETLTQALLVELEPNAAPHASIVDARAIAVIDPEVFDVLQRYVQRNHERLRQKVQKLALVRPGGIAGAVVAGFYRVLESPYPTAVFEDLEAAADWVGAPPIVAPAVENAVLEATSQDPVVANLRALLRETATRISVEQAAKRLVFSPRTLQRRLAMAGTSFVGEVQRLRLQIAKQRLRDTATPIAQIAQDAGYSSVQHFASSFRKEAGVSPGVWRSHHRTQ